MCNWRQAVHIFLPMWLSLLMPSCLHSKVHYRKQPFATKKLSESTALSFSLVILHHVPGFLCGSSFCLNFFIFSSAIYLRRLTIQQAVWPWLVILPLLSSSMERINGIRWFLRTFSTLKNNVSITRCILVISIY